MKAVIACVVIIGCIAVVVVKSFSRNGPNANEQGCLEAMKNISVAYGLYRADNDDHMPSYSGMNSAEVFKKIASYAPGKRLKCPKGSGFVHRIALNPDKKDLVYYPYGTQDLSVIAECIQHGEMRRSLRFNGIRPFWLETQVRDFTNVLTRNGAVRRVPVRPYQKWDIKGGKFLPVAKNVTATMLGRPLVTTFPFEPQPEFEY